MNDAYGNALERMLLKAHQDSASPVAGASEFDNETSNYNKYFLLLGGVAICTIIIIGLVIGIVVIINHTNESPNHPNHKNDTTIDNQETYNLRHSTLFPLAGHLKDDLEDA